MRKHKKMKLILANSSGYIPFTQKPVDYQPYRPVYLFRGPPPDLGFSYGLYKDKKSGMEYYADMGLDSFSPFSGEPAELIEEIDGGRLEGLLGDDLEKDNLHEINCPWCSASFRENLKSAVPPERELYCHRCGGELPGSFYERARKFSKWKKPEY